jgi:hypothetical protein
MHEVFIPAHRKWKREGGCVMYSFPLTGTGKERRIYEVFIPALRK